MATANFLVQKRMSHLGETFFPGEVVELDPDSDRTSILIKRGFLSHAPDAVEGSVRRIAVVAAPTVSEDLADLMKLNRSQLNDMADGLGIENPELFENKRAVATAILAAEPEDEKKQEENDAGGNGTQGDETKKEGQEA